MSVADWTRTVESRAAILQGVSVTDSDGRSLPADEGFGRWTELALRLRGQRNTIYLLGNGASASMASHFSADLAKNARLHTQVFSDLSLITAIANDISYEQVFAQPLRTRARAGDMLVAISSSGASPNILAAVSVAQELGMSVVTLSAMSPGNPLCSRGTLNIYAQAPTYGLAESAHACILHHWMDIVSAE